MKNELRNSGIGLIGNLPWGTHFCQFYQTKENLIDILIPYFKAGLENNEFCMWVTSQPLTVKEAEEALKNAVPYADTYFKRGQIEIISYKDWYIPEDTFDSKRILNGWMNKLNQALDNGYEGLRLSGNTFWLEKEYWAEFIQYEEEINDVIGKSNMMAICTYSLDN